MSAVLQIEFPWGRYQATPWNRSLNEGAVEWPPSPWRLLRAMYAAWRTHEPDLDQDVAVSLLDRLASVDPTYVVPRHTEAHTRHYLPGVAHREGVKRDTTKVINAGLVLDRGSQVWIEWPVDLPPAEVDALRLIAAGIRYLGRAESIVDVTVVEKAGGGDRIEAGVAGTADERLLAPEVPLDRKALTMTPAMVRKSRRLTPPATRWVTYRRPKPMGYRPPVTEAPVRTVDAVRFELHAAVLPSRFEAVTVGDVAHRALVSKVQDHSPTLSGKDADNKKLTRDHQHAHYLAVPDRLDGSGRRLDGLVVWAPGGFSERDLIAMMSLRRLRSWRLDKTGECGVVQVAAGRVDIVASDLAASSRTWQSLTPYSMALRHKGELIDRLRKDVVKGLAHRGIDTEVEVELVAGPWLKYRRYRPQRERLPQQRAAYGLELRFAEPVRGPLAFGALSHFGLGMFRPILE